ncbi:MAG: helix-turn-helix domain-containing protein [Halanaeroarchaeum sp.]
MSVIASLQIPATAFELGQILAVEDATSIELESLVPTGGSTIPLFWVHQTGPDSFLDTVRRHPTVNDVSTVDVFEDRTLFRLDWDARRDAVFQALIDNEGQLLEAVGTPATWEFEIRFPSHEDLRAFDARCRDAGVAIELTRVYNPGPPTEGPWFGLTDLQREALTLAVDAGYYDIPRRRTTKELAEEIGISDQAVSERLRRAIATLTRNALLVAHDDEDH